MEGDTIRPSGTNTLVDLWLVDRVRPICVTREAIAANVGFAKAEGMGEDDRCQFVRSNLSLVLSAARHALDDGEKGELVVLDGSALVAGGIVGGERRKDDRRKSERRKSARPKNGLAQPDRRRSERRQGERRRQARPKEQK